MVTTFTNKAAAEIGERARAALSRSRAIDDAQALAAARIGTVNSVCGGLVTNFAFELGISPDLRVLDKNASERALARALSRVIGQDEAASLTDIAERFQKFEWQKAISDVVDFARTNRVEVDQLAECARKSIEGFYEFLGPPIDEDGFLTDLEGAVTDLRDALYALAKPPKKGTDVVAELSEMISRTRRGQKLPWSNWAKLANFDAGKKVDSQLDAVKEVAARHGGLPALRQDAIALIQGVFDLAAKALRAYQEHKAERGLIDFVDQEVLALEALGMPEVQSRLEGSIDLVLVDEFQDTSPLQLAVFLALAKIAPRSVWVGDQKQAIYGFRGTDPVLMDAAIEAILGDAEPETLGKSYRSRPGLVRLCSEVFAETFAEHGIAGSRVRLEPAMDQEPAGLGPLVERWVLASKNKHDDAAATAAGIRDLLQDEDQRVRDETGEGTRRLVARDVAVLCRKNEECDEVAAALAALGIRAVIPRAGLLFTLEARLVKAGLMLWIDSRDRLAAAELARLCQHPNDPNSWLADVLATAEQRALPHSAQAERLVAQLAASPLAGPLDVLDAVIEAVGAREMCLSWGDAPRRLANLDALRQLAAGYVESGEGVGSSPTVTGMLAWLDALIDKEGTRARARARARTFSTWGARMR